jgi:cbb3-type cytochrome oxidase subunit 3
MGLNYWLFLPSAVILGLMWLTGVYLFFVPYLNRRRRRKSFPTADESG